MNLSKIISETADKGIIALFGLSKIDKIKLRNIFENIEDERYFLENTTECSCSFCVEAIKGIKEYLGTQ